MRAALRHEGSVGVVAADGRAAATVAALRAGGIAVATPDDDPDGPVTVLPAGTAKGLEFDHVVVVEPVEILEAEPRGANRLYVVLTRAVSRLSVVHAQPLPAALRAA